MVLESTHRSDEAGTSHEEMASVLNRFLPCRSKFEDCITTF